MNKCIIIGNLTRAPELRDTSEGIPVCNFTVAVSRRVKAGNHPEADYFRVAAWRVLGENCAKYLDKGRKVMVMGAVSTRVYTDSNGTTRAALEMVADEVEFLTPKGDKSPETGYAPVDDSEIPDGFR